LIRNGQGSTFAYTARPGPGRPFTPLARRQIQDGSSRIGWGLNEEYFYDAQNDAQQQTFLDYLIRLGYDLPMILQPIIVACRPGHP